METRKRTSSPLLFRLASRQELINIKRELKFYHSLVIFAVVMAVMIFLGAPIQVALGLWGVAVTELILLACALLAVFALRADPRVVFPLKPPPIKQFFAGIFIYGGTYCVVVVVALLTAVLFPEMNEVSEALTDVGTQYGPAAAVLVMAIMPAICEEALHRGVILAGFRGSFPDWRGRKTALAAIVICAGAIFGLFHLDPYRFLPTALLGMAFAYVALKSESMLLPMIFHFINNLLSVISMYALPVTDLADAGVLAEYSESLPAGYYVGVSLFYAGLGTLLLYCGFRLFSKVRAKLTKTLAVVLIANALIISGLAVVGVSVYGSDGFREYIDSYGGYADDYGVYGEYGFPDVSEEPAPHGGEAV